MADIQVVVDTFLQALEAKRSFVADHARRVSIYAVRLASLYGLPPDIVESIRLGALLHDVGKLMVPVHILTKPSRLDESEWIEMREHPDKGIELLGRTGLDDRTRDIILHHHERHDGKGYPDGLRGDEIAWYVRIVSVLDSFDALTSPREYRAALSIDGARALISREAGTRFCPWVVSGFLSLPTALLEPGSTEASADTYFPDGFPQMSALLATRTWLASGR